MGDLIELDPVNYNNGPKNNWRRTAWNLVHEYTADRRNALVLYLPGATNLDRALAERHGFRPANLIAIERDRQIAEVIRDRHRQSVIEGDLTNVMRSWPHNHRVSVVIADMMCCLTHPVELILLYHLAHEAFRGCTLVLNVMRGRETFTRYKLMLDLARRLHWAERATHRARALMLIHMQMLYNIHADRSVPIVDWIVDTWNGGRYREEFGLGWDILPSYQNEKGIFFDSVVIRDRGWLARDGRDPADLDIGLRSRIVAAMAVRTMRLRGDFQ